MAGSTTEDELRGFLGPQAEVARPIRIYVGLRSADDAEARAALAVRELERTGAFDRKVLVVATPTGTGRVDPIAARAIEQLYGGDTAIVAIQYSSQEGWISSLVDRDAAKEAGVALFDAVERRWSSLPSATRPKLLVFGQGLGSLGAEAAFTGEDAQGSVAALADRADGALFTGPTSDNSLWGQLVAARDGVHRCGARCTTALDPSASSTLPPRRWSTPRGRRRGCSTCSTPSDPVTFWSMSTMWSKPEWLDQPRGSGHPGRGLVVPVRHVGAGPRRPAGGVRRRPGPRSRVQRCLRRPVGRRSRRPRGGPTATRGVWRPTSLRRGDADSQLVEVGAAAAWSDSIRAVGGATAAGPRSWCCPACRARGRRPTCGT